MGKFVQIVPCKFVFLMLAWLLKSLRCNLIKQVSVNGVTGPRATVDSRVKDLLKEIKQVINKPVAAGFGIPTPDHVRRVKQTYLWIEIHHELVLYFFTELQQAN